MYNHVHVVCDMSYPLRYRTQNKNTVCGGGFCGDITLICVESHKKETKKSRTRTAVVEVQETAHVKLVEPEHVHEQQSAVQPTIGAHDGVSVSVVHT